MSIVKRRAEIVERKMDLFQEEREQWRVDHDWVEACFGLEELLKDGTEIYDDICRLDERWHLFIYRNSDCFDQSISDGIHHLYSRWLDNSTKLLEMAASIQSQYASRGFDMNRISRLAACCSECEALLNPSDVETELADRAIELHRAGATEAI